MYLRKDSNVNNLQMDKKVPLSSSKMNGQYLETALYDSGTIETVTENEG